MKRPAKLFILLPVVVAIQATLVPYMSIRWFRPDLPLLFIAWISLRKGSFFGIAAGFFAGLLIDAFTTGFLGLSSLSYSCVAFVLGRFFLRPAYPHIINWMFASAIASILFSVVFSFFYSLNTTPSFGTMVLYHALPTAFYTWVLGMIWALSPLYGRR